MLEPALAEQSPVRIQPWSVGLLAVLILVAVLWRGHLWTRVPGFTDPRHGEQVFRAENALQYRYARMLAQGQALPTTDYAAQYPEGLSVYQDLALGMEYVEVLPYRLLGLDMPFHHYLAWAVVLVSALGLIACFLSAYFIWGRPAAALVAVAIHAVHFVSFGRGIGAYSREHFALPFLFAGLPLLAVSAAWLECAASRRWGLRLAHGAGLCWAVALCTWHLSRFIFLIALGFMVLQVLWRPQRRGPAQALAITLVWCVLAALLHPMLRARGFLLSTPMLIGAVIVAAAWLPAAWSEMRRRCAIGLAVLAALTMGTLCVEGGDFSHVLYLFWAKVTHPLGPPADPSGIPFEARVLWNEAFQSPNLYVFLYGYVPLLPLAAAGAGLLLVDWRRGRSPHAGWLLYALLVFGLCFLLVNRMGVFLSFYLAVAVGRLACVGTATPAAQAHARARRRTLVAVLMLTPFLLWEANKTLHYRTYDDRYARLVQGVARPLQLPHLPGGGRALQKLLTWFERATESDAAVVAEFGLSPTLLLVTGRPIVLQPKFEVTGIRRKVHTFYDVLFGDESGFYAWCRAQQARYVVVSPESALLRGPGFPAWIAGHVDIPATSAAYRLHFFPETLAHFEIAYQNSRYRVYRVLPEGARPVRTANEPYQPLFDPDHFGATLTTPPHEDAVAHRLHNLRGAEILLENGIRMYADGHIRGAGDTLIRALHLHRGLPVARQIMADLFLRAHDMPDHVARAVDAAEKAVKCEPDVARAWLVLFRARLAARDVQGAMQALQQAQALDPEDPEIQKVMERVRY